MQDDQANVVDAIEWYMAELEPAWSEIAIDGTLVRANQTQPGLVAYYDSIHTDLDMVLELLQRKSKLIRATVAYELANNPPTNVKVSARDLANMVELDQRVQEIEFVVDTVKSIYGQYSTVLKALAQRGFSLTNIVKLRVAGMEEAPV